MVMTRTGTIVGTLILALALAGMAMPVAADDEESTALVTDTSLEITTNNFLAEGNTWTGDTVEGYVYASLCWEGSGFNPQEFSWDVALGFEDDTPEWMDAEVVVDSGSLMPAQFEVSPEGSCTQENIEFHVRINEGTGDIEPDHTHTFSFDILVSGDEAIGTYNMPDDESAQLTLTTGTFGDDGMPPPPGSETDDEENDTDNGANPENEESPAPAFAVFAILALAGAAVMRRRA